MLGPYRRHRASLKTLLLRAKSCSSIGRVFSQFEAHFSFRISTERFCFSGSDLCISEAIWDCFSRLALRASF